MEKTFGKSPKILLTATLAFIVMAVSITGISCSQEKSSDLTEIRGAYLGQIPPGRKAEPFVPSIFPEGEHLGCSGFLKNNTVFVFGCSKPNSDWRFRPIYMTEMINGRWTKLKIAPFSRYSAYNFTIGPDDQMLYFTSLLSPDMTTRMFHEQANIWAVKLEMDGWTEPMMMGKSINTEKYYENYPSVTKDGTIYYMSRREDGVGGTDVYRSRNIDGKYGLAENLGPVINTEGRDIDPFIAADESYLIVCQELEGGYGELDLFIYFWKQDGSWTEAFNLGADVNSSSFEARPCVTPDGKYLFFTSNRPGDESLNRIFWVDAAVIEDLKPDSIK